MTLLKSGNINSIFFEIDRCIRPSKIVAIDCLSSEISRISLEYSGENSQSHISNQ